MHACAYLYVEKVDRKSLGESMKMHDPILNELSEGDHYKYLGQAKAVGIDGSLIRERVVSAYYTGS